MTSPNAEAGDKLLWIAAGVVALMGVTWLIVEAPWSAQEPATLEAMPTAAPATQAPAEPRPSSVASAPPASDPLRMARMALEAGMLIEPPEYSAWTLFGRVAAGEPDNSEARAGLEQVATELLQRAGTALEQGRFDDADTIAATILERFPEHEGALALAAILERPPHVVILDVQLPSMDGFEILGRLREDPGAEDTPVLMFTSLGRQEHVQRGFELGADDYVTKPFSPTELLTRVLRLVRRR